MLHDFNLREKDVFLRPLQYNDVETLRIWRNDSNNAKYITRIPYITAEAQRVWFRKYQNDADIMTWAIEYDECLAGSVSLYSFNNGCAEFGKLTIGDKALRGKGLGLLATIACLRIGFSDLGLSNISATVHTENLAALIIYVKAGFCIIGRQSFSGDVEGNEYIISLSKERYGKLCD